MLAGISILSPARSKSWVPATVRNSSPDTTTLTSPKGCFFSTCFCSFNTLSSFGSRPSDSRIERTCSALGGVGACHLRINIKTPINQISVRISKKCTYSYQIHGQTTVIQLVYNYFRKNSKEFVIKQLSFSVLLSIENSDNLIWGEFESIRN